MTQAPVRGTQSFVGIMAQVWKRPSLLALEIVWRWLAGGLALVLVAPTILGSLGIDLHLGAKVAAAPDFTALQNLTVFKPVAAVQTLQAVFIAIFEPLWPSLQWRIPAACALWLILAAFGRTVTLLRLDPTLHARRISLFVLGTIRAILLLFTWFLWSRGIALAAHVAITGPAARGQEPSVVIFAAMVISGTLVLYVLWGIVSWPLHLAPPLAMMHDLRPVAALRTAIASNRVRGKLIEINLVMNIARIALIVLAMVSSASPLPFTTVATQGFLELWWCVTILVYLAANDYFHVVRAASYLSLYRALEIPENPA